MSQDLSRALQFNLVLLGMIVGGTVVLWRLSGPLALTWTLAVLFSFYYYLRKHLCTNCPFYGKPCYTGWGLLASKMFPKGSGDFDKGRRYAPIAWSVFLVVPALSALYLGGWLFLFLWLFGSAYLVLEHLSFCKRCPLRDACRRNLYDMSNLS